MTQSYKSAKRRSAASVTRTSSSKRNAKAAFLLCWLLALLGCQRRQLSVREVVTPEYPDDARIDNIQGTVQLGIQIGIDGKVLWAHGSGAPPVLVEAAQKNALKWIWGSFPQEAEFPFYHEIEYVYKLEGKPAPVVVNPPTIRTYLPDRIEIIATPYKSDFEVVPVKPAPDTKKHQFVVPQH